MRIIAKLAKGDEVRFVSHLDIQRLLQRAFRRAGIPLAYSQGFNPHPQLSFATALATGYTSAAEWVDVKLERELAAREFLSAANAALPKGFALLEAYAVEEKLPALTALLSLARYAVTFAPGTDAEALRRDIAALLRGPIVVEKRTKGGMKSVDIRPQVNAAEVTDAEEGGGAVLRLSGALNASGSMNIELLLGALREQTGLTYEYSVHREDVLFQNGKSVPV